MKNNMERKTNENLFLQLKSITNKFILGLLYLFCVYWCFGAIFKYQDEPAITRRTWKFGDNEKGIEFPLITFCPKIPYDNQMIFKNECGLNGTLSHQEDFHHLLQLCLQENINVDMKNLIKKFGLFHILLHRGMWISKMSEKKQYSKTAEVLALSNITTIQLNPGRP